MGAVQQCKLKEEEGCRLLSNFRMLYSLAISTLFCLMFSAVSGQSNGANCCNCPLGWDCFRTAQYKYIPQLMSWIDAELYCQKLYPGAHLVSIHSIDENDYIDYVIFKEAKARPTTWIGASDCYKDRLFLWVDGSQMNYQNFARGEPNNAGGSREPCLNFNYLSPKTWNDGTCESLLPFVCKYTYSWPL